MKSIARPLRLIGLVTALVLLPTMQPVQAAANLGLREVAERKGVFVGTMLWGVGRQEITDLETMRTVCTEFNMLATGNALKWDVVHPAPGKYDWVPAERLFAVATACNLRFTATPLVWHWQLPAWVKALDGHPAQLRDALREHITRLVSRFAGRVAAWDVVNEALESDGRMKDTIWRRNLGPGFVADAFRWARAADPKAKLYYNDFSSDGLGRKGNAVYRWVQRWRTQGAPIDGVGIQVHGPAESRSRDDLIGNLRRLHSLGLDTRLSEIALPIGPGAYSSPKAQATMYYVLAHACFSAGTGCRMFTVWGVSDRDYKPVAAWKGSCCGLLFDESFGRKPAYFAVRDAISGAVSPSQA